MSSLNDMYDEVDGEPKEPQTYNEMPSGKYNVRVFRVSLREAKSGMQYIEIAGDIESGEYEGSMMNAIFSFPENYPDVAISNMDRFKAFNKLCNCKFKPEMLSDPVVQDWYSGIVFECNHVVKPNLKNPNKGPFHNWYFNRLIKGKQQDGDMDRPAPPSQPPKPKTDEIDLDDDDPFGEELS